MSDLAPRPFCYLRHGETDWNAQGRSQGRIDIPLNDVGREQAARASALLADETFATIIASPLSRARVTAEIVAAPHGLPVLFDGELQEVSFGEQEGQPVGAWYDDWIAGGYTPAGGESFAALRARAVAAVDRATAHPGPVLIVAHGALFRALRSAMGLTPSIRTLNAVPLHCVPDGDAGWTVTERR